jgi:hypothetical protein
MLIQIIDVLIGLTVVYLIFSTVASSAMELIETLLRRRAALLIKGIEEIFKIARAPDQRGQIASDVGKLVVAFYRLVPIASLYVGDLRSEAGKLRVDGGQLPSYLPARRFAGAVLAAIAGAPSQIPAPADAPPADAPPGSAGPVPAPGVPADQAAPAELAAQCQRILAVALQLYADDNPDADDSLETRRDALEQFFNDNTERMTSWYRRHVRWVLLAIGLVLAVALNINTLHIARTLSEDSDLREHIVTQALADLNVDSPLGYQLGCSLAPTADADPASGPSAATTPAAAPADSAGQEKLAEDCEQQLREGIQRRLAYAESLGLPLGWSNDSLPSRALPNGQYYSEWLMKLLGWLMTALAICVGAPFWFDILNRLANIRTALKPEEEAK